MLEMDSPAISEVEPRERKPRGRKRFGRPRLLIIGCGDVGLRIVARLRDRFRIIATTASTLRVVELRAAGTVPLVVNLDIAPNLARMRAFCKYWIDLAPPPASGAGDPRTRRLRCACGTRVERAVYVSTTGVYGNRD